MSKLKKMQAYKKRLDEGPLTNESYVLGELVESQISNFNLKADNEQLRNTIDEKEHLLDVLAKVLLPFHFDFDGENYFQVNESYVRIGRTDSFTMDEARTVKDFIVSRMPRPQSEDE